MTSIIVKSPSPRPDSEWLFVTEKTEGDFDWSPSLGAAARFPDEKTAKAALRTLGWNSRMKDAVRFLRVGEINRL